MHFTVYPRHNAASYTVEEHDIVTCPPDLWPFIKAWLASCKENYSCS